MNCGARPTVPGLDQGQSLIVAQRRVAPREGFDQPFQLRLRLLEPTTEINHRQIDPGVTGCSHHLQVVTPPQLLGPIGIHARERTIAAQQRCGYFSGITHSEQQPQRNLEVMGQLQPERQQSAAAGIFDRPQGQLAAGLRLQQRVQAGARVRSGRMLQPLVRQRQGAPGSPGLQIVSSRCGPPPSPRNSLGVC